MKAFLYRTFCVNQIIKTNIVFRFRALGIDRAVENAELQDKLEKAQNELRRAQVICGNYYDIRHKCNELKFYDVLD